jgi:hypothetical protein
MTDVIFAGREGLREEAIHPFASGNFAEFNQTPRAIVLAWWFWLMLHDHLEHECLIKDQLNGILDRKTPRKAESDSAPCVNLDLVIQSIYPDIEEMEKLICREWGYVNPKIAERIALLAGHVDENVKEWHWMFGQLPRENPVPPWDK